MTTTKLIENARKLIGRTADLKAKTLMVGVKIIDANYRYGRIDLKVAPLDGSGETWVQHDRRRIQLRDEMPSAPNAQRAIDRLISTIENTGGVIANPDGTHAPVGEDEWIDLADAYLAACAEAGRTPKIFQDDPAPDKESEVED